MFLKCAEAFLLYNGSSLIRKRIVPGPYSVLEASIQNFFDLIFANSKLLFSNQNCKFIFGQKELLFSNDYG